MNNNEKVSAIEALKFCIKWTIKYPTLVFFTVLPAILVPLDHALQPFFLKKIIDTITIFSGNELVGKVLPFIIGYIMCSIFWEVSWRLHSYIVNVRLDPKLRQDIFLDTVDKILGKSHRFYQNEMSGKLTKRLMDLSDLPIQVKWLVLNRGILRTVSLVSSVVTLFLCNKIFGIIILIFCIILGYVVYYFLPKIIASSEDYSDQGSVINGEVNDTITNINSVRFFANWKLEKSILKKSTDIALHKERKMEKLYLILFTWASVTFVLLQGISLFFLLKLRIINAITPGDFALVMDINFILIQNIWDGTFDLMDFTKHLGKTQQALKSVYAEVEVLDSKNAKDLVVNKGEIIFDRVNFKYEENLSNAFENFSCKINAGEKVGLVGESGAGKTSFINLLLRSYDIQSGQIIIDQQNISSVTQDSLHKNISVIPQDPSLFHRTLHENIHYGDFSKNEKEVYEAAKLASAEEFILQTENGYQTLVGERGVKLSGGQRQRIAIARAFLKNAPILILDEATSALDSITEREIQKSLWKLMQNKTCIVIAHRLSTLVDMDRILVFDGGKIVEEGNHKDLIEKNGVYRKLWDSQSVIKPI